jgi:hypothetical protein
LGSWRISIVFYKSAGQGVVGGDELIVAAKEWPVVGDSAAFEVEWSVVGGGCSVCEAEIGVVDEEEAVRL